MGRDSNIKKKPGNEMEDISKVPRIVIIGFYYGVLPLWMPYWLRSCADNPTVDFLLVTDIEIDSLPANVRKIEMTLRQVKDLCEEKLNMKVALDVPYKLCDYKPVYGIILEDYIKGYDYWGHCDFDLIWGDIRTFADIYHLEQYDKFLPLGHLSIYRNTKKCNGYFKLEGSRCGNYQTVFSNPSNYAFDEVKGIYSIYEYNRLPMFRERIFAEIKTYHKRFRLKPCDRNYKHQVFYYENGKVFRAYEIAGRIEKEEYVYIHFRRKLHADKLRDWNDVSSFYITPNGFIDKEPGTPNVEEIEKYNTNPGFIAEKLETIRFCVKNFNNISSKLKFELVALKGKRKSRKNEK